MFSDVSRKSEKSDQHIPRPTHSGVREKSSIAISPCRVKPRIASNLATNLQIYDIISTHKHITEQEFYIVVQKPDPRDIILQTTAPDMAHSDYYAPAV